MRDKELNKMEIRHKYLVPLRGTGAFHYRRVFFLLKSDGSSIYT